jgi:hypothetical protein
VTADHDLYLRTGQFCSLTLTQLVLSVGLIQKHKAEIIKALTGSVGLKYAEYKRDES